MGGGGWDRHETYTTIIYGLHVTRMINKTPKPLVLSLPFDVMWLLLLLAPR